MLRQELGACSGLRENCALGWRWEGVASKLPHLLKLHGSVLEGWGKPRDGFVYVEGLSARVRCPFCLSCVSHLEGVIRPLGNSRKPGNFIAPMPNAFFSAQSTLYSPEATAALRGQ